MCFLGYLAWDSILAVSCIVINGKVATIKNITNNVSLLDVFFASKMRKGKVTLLKL